MLRRNLQRRAFTLIEIIVVAALISLLSGIAIFAINEMYNRNIRKTALAESFQLATALSMAQNDLQFYPNLAYLVRPSELIVTEFPDGATPTESNFNWSDTPNSMLHGIDYYGFIRGTGINESSQLKPPPLLLRIINNWRGPYMAVSPARQGATQVAQSGIVRMRLPELAERHDRDGWSVGGNDISVVNWPADPFGNPWVLYLMRVHIDEDGRNIPSFLDNPSQEGSFKTMVASAGRNRFPGGNELTSRAFGDNVLARGALYVRGDRYSGVGNQTADFTLKVIDRREILGPARNVEEVADDNTLMGLIEVRDADLLLSNDVAAVLAQDDTHPHYQVLRSLSLESADAANFDEALGQVGILDPGSDDIFLEF